MEEAIVRYIHFMGIILLSSMLVAENILISTQLKNDTVKKLVTIDGLYGFGAIVTLTAGLLLWFSVGKPALFYTNNSLFHIKLGLFLLIGLASIIPTVFLFKHRRTTSDIVNIPHYIVFTKRLELLFLLALPLLATLMARGIGSG